MFRFFQGTQDGEVGMRVFAKLTDAEHARLDSHLEQTGQDSDGMRLLIQIDPLLTMIEPATFWKDVAMNVPAFSTVKRLAVVAPARWLEAYYQAVDSALPTEQTRVFEHTGTGLEEAWRWLRSESGTEEGKATSAVVETRQERSQS